MRPGAGAKVGAGVGTSVSVGGKVGAGEAVDVGSVVVARVSSPAQAARTTADISADVIRIRLPKIPGIVNHSLIFGLAVALF